jgi:beta-barrel assembly-enhancing protease
MPRQSPVQSPLLVFATLLLVAPAFCASDFKFKKGDLELLQEADSLDQQLERDGLVYEDAETTRYVESVGKSVLPQGPPPEGVKWQFRVLRDAEPNAFALPNGSVYIYTGLLSLLHNQAQLAAVLAHEEAHVLKRHAYLDSRSRHKKAVALDLIVAGLAHNDTGLNQLATSLISPVATRLMNVSIFGYDRTLEREADMSGLATLEKAGYQPEEMVAALRLQEQAVGQDQSPALYRDHPRLEERMEYLSEARKANPPGPGPFLVRQEEYDQAMQSVFRHDFGLELTAGQPRRAISIAQHLLDKSSTSENYRLLGDAHRAMGGRLPNPSAQQLSSERTQAAKMLRTMTRQEYEKALLAAPEGQAAWKENRRQAEAAYQEALKLDPSNAETFRGLGFVYEDEGKNVEAIAVFQKYLQMAPQAWDRRRILLDLARLQASVGEH